MYSVLGSSGLPVSSGWYMISLIRRFWATGPTAKTASFNALHRPSNVRALTCVLSRQLDGVAELDRRRRDVALAVLARHQLHEIRKSELSTGVLSAVDRQQVRALPQQAGVVGDVEARPDDGGIVRIAAGGRRSSTAARR